MKDKIRKSLESNNEEEKRRGTGTRPGSGSRAGIEGAIKKTTDKEGPDFLKK